MTGRKTPSYLLTPFFLTYPLLRTHPHPPGWKGEAGDIFQQQNWQSLSSSFTISKDSDPPRHRPWQDSTELGLCSSAAATELASLSKYLWDRNPRMVSKQTLPYLKFSVVSAVVPAATITTGFDRTPAEIFGE